MTLAFLGIVFLFVWFAVGVAVLGSFAYGLYWVVSGWNDGSDDVTDPTCERTTDET